MDEDKAVFLRDHLMSPKMFSGWGIRTMAEGEAGYNPIEYHNGTVWPHDCSIIAAGLARYGFRKEAADVIAGVFEASITCAPTSATCCGAASWTRTKPSSSATT